MRTLFLSLVLIASFATGVGCSQDLAWSTVLESIRQEYPSVPQITTDSLASWLADPSATQPLLLDVREPAEYAVSHLPGAIRVSPDGSGGQALAGLDKDTPIVTYCSVGYRSSALAQRLRETGYTNVVNLEGSLFRWANEGRPVYRDAARTSQVHPYNALWGTLLKNDLHARDTGN